MTDIDMNNSYTIALIVCVIIIVIVAVCFTAQPPQPVGVVYDNSADKDFVAYPSLAPYPDVNKQYSDINLPVTNLVKNTEGNQPTTGTVSRTIDDYNKSLVSTGTSGLQPDSGISSDQQSHIEYARGVLATDGILRDVIDTSINQRNASHWFTGRHINYEYLPKYEPYQKSVATADGAEYEIPFRTETMYGI